MDDAVLSAEYLTAGPALTSSIFSSIIPIVFEMFTGYCINPCKVQKLTEHAHGSANSARKHAYRTVENRK